MKTLPGKRFWLIKSEPDTYSIDQLKNDGSTAWNGVRNYQARNFLKDVKKGDLLLFYHSGKDKSVVGLAKCKSEFYPEPIKDEPDTWVQIDVEFVEKFRTPVALSILKSTPILKDLLLIRHTRLSTMPIPEPAFQTILSLGKEKI